MIEAIPKRAWYNDYEIRRDNQVLAELSTSLRRKALVVIGGDQYRLYREGLWGAFVLRQERRVLARAVKTARAKDGYALEIGAGRLALRRTSVKDRRFGVSDGEKEVGSICRSDPNSRRTRIELPGQWPLAERLFVFWLALRTWMSDEAYESA